MPAAGGDGTAVSDGGGGMNHFCVCGHLSKFHNMDFGRCEGLDATLFYPEDQPCTCDHYEKDSGDD